jgi:hypothetical protein
MIIISSVLGELLLFKSHREKCNDQLVFLIYLSTDAAIKLETFASESLKVGLRFEVFHEINRKKLEVI